MATLFKPFSTRRASIYRILGKYDLALQDLNQAIKFDARYAEGYINRGLTYYQLENYRQALINLNHVISFIDSQDPRAYLARGFIYQKLEERTQAKADFIRAFNLYSIAQKAEVKEQEINHGIAQYSQLSTDFYHIMQLDYEEANILFGQGIAYLILDDKELALANFTEAKNLFQLEQDKFSIRLMKKTIMQVQEPIEQSNNHPQQDLSEK